MSSIEARPHETSGPPTDLQSPQDVLRKMLSTTFVLPDSSRYDAQYHEVTRRDARKNYEETDRARRQAIAGYADPSLVRTIGWGSCGIVYERLGTTYVLKRAINGNAALSEDCRLSNDLVMHQAVEDAFNRVT